MGSVEKKRAPIRRKGGAREGMRSLSNPARRDELIVLFDE